MLEMSLSYNCWLHGFSQIKLPQAEHVGKEDLA